MNTFTSEKQNKSALGQSPRTPSSALGKSADVFTKLLDDEAAHERADLAREACDRSSHRSSSNLSKSVGDLGRGKNYQHNHKKMLKRKEKQRKKKQELHASQVTAELGRETVTEVKEEQKEVIVEEHADTNQAPPPAGEVRPKEAKPEEAISEEAKPEIGSSTQPEPA